MMCRKLVYLILILSFGLAIDVANGQSSVKINFQGAKDPSSPNHGSGEVPLGYLPDWGDIFGDRGNGFSYGWTNDRTGRARDRDINPDQRYDTLNQLTSWGISPASWEIEVPNAV